MSRRSRHTSTKFVTYFQLLDAFKEPGCPVCSLLTRGAEKALDSLMYEQVNDPMTRDRLVASHGFCNWHAWILPRIGNSATGVAIIYKHLLEVALSVLDATRHGSDPAPHGNGGRRPWTRRRREPSALLVWREKRAPCFLCTLSGGSERDMLRTLLDYIAEPEFAEAFASSAGLCLPHLERVVAIGRDHPHLGALLDAHVTRWRDLGWELGEFVRKMDYRYVDEARGREGTSWSRALELFTGRAGLFGSDRERTGKTGRLMPEASRAGQTDPPPPETGADSDASEIERLRFENEQLRRRVDDLARQREGDRRRRIALEFRIHKLLVDLRAMAAGAEGVRVPDAPPELATATGVAVTDDPELSQDDRR